jgi:hypothetical protein
MTGSPPTNISGSATVAFKTNGGNVTIGTATCGAVNVMNIPTLISQPLIIPVPKGTIFDVTIEKNSSALSPKFVFSFVPFGLSGSAAISKN